mmetsp:Transcript_36020/g.88041  ORF Transcript_36020/g.88041 Transcript_36020/m.88041 type:complete len:208 (+) Transcript_36020:690-1313(+)
MTASPFFALILGNHRPHRCSSPMAAATTRFCEPTAKLLTNPGTGTEVRPVNSKTPGLSFAAHCQNLTKPLLAPDTTKSENGAAATEDTQVLSPWAPGTTQVGFFFARLHAASAPSSPPLTNTLSVSMATASTQRCGARKTSCDPSATFQSRRVPSRPPVSALSRFKASTAHTSAPWPKSVSMYVISPASQTLTVRSSDTEYKRFSPF